MINFFKNLLTFIQKLDIIYKYWHIAGWSSWQLVGLITQRSEVRVLPPQPIIIKHLLEYSKCFFYVNIFKIHFLTDYQEPPPPPPEPPPEEPPPLSLYGLDDIAVVADDIVDVINELKVLMSKSFLESYQSGACRAIVSNWLTHTSDTPKAYVYGNIL